ncbi:unnamed protein product [Effrenium voratum]|uniref:Uncharacterized protein n=1 Tax=Effrenium voratum TaxID=2562239 RepID=A0AA36IJ16_9DINO|nr:unnamed protein product [Effrenium voratum]
MVVCNVIVVTAEIFGRSPRFLWFYVLCLLCGADDPRRLQPQSFIAGQFHPLGAVALQGLDDSLYRAGRLRVRPLGSACGEAGSSLMDAAVQPPCVGNICNGAHTRHGDMAVWEAVRIVRVGIYQLCWCRPSLACDAASNCCQADAAFSEDVGQVEVAGPGWVSVSPVLGQGFRFQLEGPEVLPGMQALLRLRVKGPCGFTPFRDAAELKASTLQFAAEEHENLVLATSPPTDLNISGQMGSQMMVAYLQRHLAYSVCWCARDCTFPDGSIDEEAFSAEVGEFFPRGPDTERTEPQLVVAGVSFDLAVQGDRLSANDRVLVPAAETVCGDQSTAHALAFRLHICGRGSSDCIATPANGPPTSFQNLGDLVGESGLSFRQEAWSPVQIDTPGTYRICWCVDDSYDPVKLESYGFCGSGHQFSVQAGLILVQGTFGDQFFSCSAFQSCRLPVLSELSFDFEDRLLIVAPPPTSTNSLAAMCGRGTTGLQVQLASTRGIYPTTTPHPNASLDALHFVGEFDLASAGQAGLYRVCYCKSSAMGPCDDPVAFAQFAGVLNITGKIEYNETNGVHQECLASRACRFNITGVWAMQLSFLDSFRAVPDDLDCSDISDSSAYPYFSLRTRTQLPDSWMSEFTHKAGAEDFYFTGDYRLCYCQASLTSDGTCDTPAEHSQEVGTLFIVGAMSRMDWTCRQGAQCKLVVHGWRATQNDSVRLVAPSFPCGAPDPEDLALGQGFDSNPAVANRSDSLSNGVLLQFDLGKARGAGKWRVCFCVSALGGCSKASDFAQEAGELIIEGLLRSVTPSSQPATVAMATVLVDVIEPGQPMGVACAASNQSLDSAPSSVAVLTCQDSIPGCLGLTVLPWGADQGFNVLHIPFAENALAAAGFEARAAHIWCTGDISLCPTGRCVLPPTRAGLQLALSDGVEPWTSFSSAVGESVELQVQGNPLNAEGGWLKMVWPQDGCPQVGQAWAEPIISPFELGRPASASPGSSVRWRLTAPFAGLFWLCWCDRSYGADCALWQHVGELVIAGPINVSGIPPAVEPSEEFNITMTGVNLTSEERISLHPGMECTEDVPMVGPCKVFAGLTRADFQVQAPQQAGYYTVCWTRGNESSESRKMGAGFARESRDCILAGWEYAPSSDSYPFPAGDGQACSRECGGGFYELRRRIIAQAVGGGLPCPAADSVERSRFRPCNEHSCPEAQAFNAFTQPSWVRPGDFFQVIVNGTDFDPSEDRMVLVTGGESVLCGEVTNRTDAGIFNMSNVTGMNISESESVVLRGGGASCSQPASNSTYLECGDGVASLHLTLAGAYRLCICDASAVNIDYINVSGSILASRERCSRLEDYKVMPSNGSLVHITYTDVQEEESKNVVDAALGVLGINGFAEDGKSRNDILLILGLIGAAALYCCAVFCACWFWRYRWRKRGDWRRNVPKMFANTLVAKATRAAWEAYSRAVTEQTSDDDAKDAVESGEPVQAPLTDLMSFQAGSLTPPGTGVSLKSGSSAFSSSTSSTRATTPGNHPSLLKVSLQKDVHRPVSPKMGGSFLDLPLAGRGTKSTANSPSRPGTAATAISISEEPAELKGSEVKQATSPKSGKSSCAGTPPEAEDASPKRAPPPRSSRSEPGLEMQLPGLQRKLAKLKEEQSESSDESPQVPTKSLVPAPPAMAPPSLPGQAEAEQVSKEVSQQATATSPRPSEVPKAPLKVPALTMLRPLPPPPARLKTEAEASNAPSEDKMELPKTEEEPSKETESEGAEHEQELERREEEKEETAAEEKVVEEVEEKAEEKVEEKLEEKLEEKAQEKVEEKIEEITEEKIEEKVEEQVEEKIEEKAEEKEVKKEAEQGEKEEKEGKDETASESTPKSMEKGGSSPPKFSSWLTDMRSRVSNKSTAETKIAPPPPPSKRFAPSGALSAGRSDLQVAKAPFQEKNAKEVDSPGLIRSRPQLPELSRLQCQGSSSQPDTPTAEVAAPMPPGDQTETVALEAQVAESKSKPPDFSVAGRAALPTGNWEDAQEKLRQEWHQKLAAGVDENEKPRRGKASLRGAANGRSQRPGASLRGSATASAAGSQAGSMAPSRASQSPVTSPRTDPPPAPAPAPGLGPTLGPTGPMGPGPPLPGSPPGPPGPRPPRPGQPQSRLAPNWAF